MEPHKVPVRILKHQAGAFRLIFDGKPKTITLVWGRGLGKSFFIRLIIWLLIAKYYGKKRKTLDGEISGIRVYMLMPTLKQFKQVHGALFEAENNGKWSFLGGKLNKTDYSITFPDGSIFIPVPAALATSETGRGLRGDVTVYDEADDIDPSVRTSIAQPWFSELWSLAIEIKAGTPKRGRHGLLYQGHADGLSKDPELSDCFTFRSKSADCPEIFNPRLLAAAKRNTPKAIFAREYEADFDSAEGLVYPFDDEKHVLAPPDNIKFSRRGLGIDHGWEDPGVFLEWGTFGRGNDRILWILDEHYHQHKPNSEWDELATTLYSGFPAWADPSRPDRIADLRKAGLSIQGANNSIKQGVPRVAELLSFRFSEEEGAEPWCRLYVHPRCVNTIREFKSYRRKRDPHDANLFLEDIEDRNNHAMDCVRYIAISEFGPYAGAGRHEVADS